MHARMHAAAGIADLLGGWVGGGSGGILGTLPVVQPCSFFSPTGRRRMGGVRKNKSEYVRWPSCGNFGIGWRQTRDFFFILSCYIVCERAVRFHATHQVVAFFSFWFLHVWRVWGRAFGRTANVLWPHTITVPRLLWKLPVPRVQYASEAHMAGYGEGGKGRIGRQFFLLLLPSLSDILLWRPCGTVS